MFWEVHNQLRDRDSHGGNPSGIPTLTCQLVQIPQNKEVGPNNYALVALPHWQLQMKKLGSGSLPDVTSYLKDKEI